METSLISKWCRICSIEFESGIFLFGEEAKRLFLHAKIRRYLALTISVEDKLPKMICQECCKKLEYFHRFASMALKNQDKMIKFVCTNFSSNNHQTETKSLLHTYLTKGVIEKIDTEPEITEMEVRIDPMSILQYSQEHEDDDDGDEKNDNADNSINKNADMGRVSSSFEENNLNKYRKPYLCTQCSRSFTSELALQNHNWNHSSLIKCLLINHNNNENQKFEENISTNNDDDIDDDTDQEQDDDDDDDDDNNNNNSNNNNEDDDDDDDDSDECKNKQFSCPICGKIISTKGNLKVHLETHRPKGKYGCDICGRIFKTQCNLYRHKEYHGGIQYTCGVCGRVYPTNSTLRAHSITHSDLRPHKCPLCDKTFKRNQDLKFHINQHTGARPYQCPYCPKAFASSGNCFSHRKRMHPVEVERDRERAAKIMR